MATLKAWMIQKEEGTLPPEKLRCSDYLIETAKFDRRASLFTRAVTTSEGVYSSRKSFVVSADKPVAKLDKAKFESITNSLNRQSGKIAVPPPLPRSKNETSKKFTQMHSSLSSLFGVVSSAEAINEKQTPTAADKKKNYQ